MGCQTCKKRETSNIVCSDCGQNFPFVHREDVNVNDLLVRRRVECPNCHSKNIGKGAV
jgi:DNA-directed RNA polymerase subunit RPC12/RpoP